MARTVLVIGVLAALLVVMGCSKDEAAPAAGQAATGQAGDNAASNYMNKGKTVEAIDNMDKIVKGAAMYISTPRVDPKTGEKLPCQYPASQAATPEKSCCKKLGQNDANGNDKCDANPKNWESPTWKALLFDIPEEHYFRYEVISSGTGSEAKFELRAYADLDCDGVESTFIRRAAAMAVGGGEGAKATECGFAPGGASEVINEVE